MKLVSHLKVYALLWLLLISLSGFGTIKTASSTGDWGSSGIWSSGTLPACGDTIIIPSGKTVTIDHETFDLEAGGCPKTLVKVYGVLAFNNPAHLKLACNSIVAIEAGGKLDNVQGGGTSNFIDVCSVDVWDAGNGDLNGPVCMPSGNSGCSVALPVDMISFDAEWNKKQTLSINWVTATEVNNQGFEILRSSDNLSFETIGVTAGHGNSSVPNYYSYSDDGAVSVTGKYIYYMLTQVDYDGHAKTYGPVAVKTLNSAQEVVIYPNPVQKNSMLHLVLNEPGSASLILVDVFGRTVFTKDISSSVSDPRVNISLPEVATGMYTVTIQQDGLSQQKKLVIAD